ncbi:SulP family inorganic anion transporter [Aliibacillus thermotolerans]|uniref:SulP family inorganic anion transporter n=1 Tax=Aliibacillus thermotolerans TaxID=1834418 RepID=A0ABW0U901_9BACI|nr:SulP family inorganic anion transporter [Aliibacillus thermotolerans]MDA3129566.1 STAS domain-containing protein [Aliibacillus thermotolerans]
MNVLQKWKNEWFGNVRGDILAGIVVALALIPEAIAFSIIAGVDPMVGLYASFCISVVIAFVGGRPGMISAATGAMALLMVTLVANHGLEYLLATTILTGILQILFGWSRLSRLMKFIPRSVMVGFVNALAILIFLAQMDHFVGEGWLMYVLVALTLLIIYLFPIINKTIPSTLVAIIAVSAIAIMIGADVRTVGDMGALPDTLPVFLLPDVPLTWETLTIIFPYALALSIVGLLETLLTAAIVDDMTETESDKDQECRGQGYANVITGFFGGMAGCAMIGQSVINVKSGGSGRLSTFVAGMFLMILILILGDLVVQIPMAALVGVMIMVSISTFDWNSIKLMTKIPKTDTVVMVVTVGTVVVTNDLSKGVLAGVVLSAIFFAAKISKVKVTGHMVDALNRMIYTVDGQLFFASVTEFMNSFEYQQDHIKIIEIDFTNAHIWDDSAVEAIEKVKSKFEQQGIKVVLTNMNKESSQLMKRLEGLSG